ncbi:hypothetical protein [Mycolicibacterium sp.]|uniref:hypothetical protein n=1 Tax=Mycolicibacterium sp. TaxID=2320850 RepID=UPI0037CA7B62
MRIDVVHQRDPDASCDIAVYVDGQKVEFHDWDFDPGTGYTEADFEETKKSTLDDAPDFLKPVLAKAFDEMAPTYERLGL